MAADHSIVFVHLGSELPRWSCDALTQAALFNGCPIYLLADADALRAAKLPQGVRGVALEEIGLSEQQREFRELWPADSGFRDGFWTYTTERFFALDSFVQHAQLEHVVHLENDVMLYADLDKLVPKLASRYTGMAGTFDNDHRCIPGLLYVADPLCLADLTDFILSALEHARSLPQQESEGINDMVLLAAWRAHFPDDMGALPIVPPDYPALLRSQAGNVPGDAALYWNNFDALGMVFDAAALGQYLGGVDPRNRPPPSHGFINEGCVFDPRLVKPRMEPGADGLRRPVIETPGGIRPVANLHVHSKNLQAFLSRP